MLFKGSFHTFFHGSVWLNAESWVIELLNCKPNRFNDPDAAKIKAMNRSGELCEPIMLNTYFKNCS